MSDKSTWEYFEEILEHAKNGAYPTNIKVKVGMNCNQCTNYFNGLQTLGLTESYEGPDGEKIITTDHGKRFLKEFRSKLKNKFPEIFSQSVKSSKLTRRPF